MRALAQARKLAEFIRTIDGFAVVPPPQPSVHHHLGGALADAVLQAGLNYRSVVHPRVERLKRKWPTSRVASGLLRDLSRSGPHEMLNWHHSEKPRRFVALAELCASYGLETEEDLCAWIINGGSRSVLLQLSGIGPKTVDYLARLVGAATVAVDRHVRRFATMAGVHCSDYGDIKQTVCFAADLLGMERAHLDHAIWHFMAAPR